ncbi:hypothetical protein G9A89_005287 [Geosiphon pyriformis]|nr:hypothetical protein G9A89_005287 [Geosiphon pyriformis]
MEVSEAKEYTIIISNKWLKKAKVLLDYELCELTIRYEKQEKTAKLTYTIFISNGKPLDNVKADKERIMVNGKLICWLYYDILRKIFDRKPDKKAKYSASTINFCIPLVMNASSEPISLIPREELKKVQKFFENKPPETQLLVVKQRESSLEERKVNIKNLLAKNSPVISKENNISGQTHIIQHTITTKETCPIYLKPY